MDLYKAMAAIAVLGGGLLALGAVFSSNEHGIKWILGGIGWFGFLICALALIVLALVALGRGVRRKVTV